MERKTVIIAGEPVDLERRICVGGCGLALWVPPKSEQKTARQYCDELCRAGGVKLPTDCMGKPERSRVLGRRREKMPIKDSVLTRFDAIVSMAERLTAEGRKFSWRALAEAHEGTYAAWTSLVYALKGDPRHARYEKAMAAAREAGVISRLAKADEFRPLVSALVQEGVKPVSTKAPDPDPGGLEWRAACIDHAEGCPVTCANYRASNGETVPIELSGAIGKDEPKIQMSYFEDPEDGGQSMEDAVRSAIAEEMVAEQIVGPGPGLAKDRLIHGTPGAPGDPDVAALRDRAFSGLGTTSSRPKRAGRYDVIIVRDVELGDLSAVLAAVRSR